MDKELNERAVAALRSTKESLFVRGWTKGGYGPNEGPNCLAGAIIHQACRLEGDDVYYLSYDTVANILLTQTGSSITCFNDKPGTTFDDVINVLDFAIKTLEER